MFGKWTDRTAQLADHFRLASPFEHVVISNFFAEEVAELLATAFPHPDDPEFHWHRYDNPIENKYAFNDFECTPKIKDIVDKLQSDDTVTLLKKLTGIPNLEADPHLHGAGLHASPRGGKLDVHLDYMTHPISGKERRINLIFYLSKEWRSEWGGELELWDADRTKCVRKLLPTWNTAVIFRTSDLSYHGHPRPITCPPDVFRKSLAIYYVSDPRGTCAKRIKAEFYPHPEQPVSPTLQELYEIRRHRLISSTDLQKWPSWRVDGGGWW